MITRLLKTAACYALYFSGVLQLWQTYVMRRRAVVLMYHRVLTNEERCKSASHPAIVVSVETFKRHMSLLKRRFSVLSLAEFAACFERGIPFPDRACVITFDDGWIDNYRNALPVLKEHALPAVVFLPASYIGTRRLFWPEALTHLVVRAVHEARSDGSCRTRLRALLAPAGLEHLLDLAEENPRPAIIEAVRSARRLSRAGIDRLIVRLASELGQDPVDLTTTDAYIDWNEAQLMVESGVAVGGHGAEHLLLTEVSAPEAEDEITMAKNMLDRRFPDVVPTFSYPNGYHTAEIAQKVKDAGYRLAFVTRRGFVRSSDDPFTIRRLNVHEDGTASLPMFLARIVGLV